MPQSTSQNLIGLMSGTSLDGLDLACVKFNQNQNTIDWEWIATDCIPYTQHWRKKLKDAHLLDGQDLIQLDAYYGQYIGEQVQLFIQKHQLEYIDAIASHGHTVFHQPKKGFTLQIGHGAHIQAITNIPVICDFRSQDVALGGQGAPLVPIGDKILFSDYDACINLGGFANISFDNQEGNRIAFDMAPVNYVLNYYAAHLGLPYDAEGKIAERGNIQLDLFSQLNDLAFYKELGPKSLGREWVEKKIFPMLKNHHQSPENILATFTAHTAYQIAQVLNQNNFKKVLFSGGGALNKFLMQTIQNQTHAEIIIADNQLLNYKEALVFALLGYLKLQNQTNILKSVTGASRDSSAGVIYR
ncbi:anhydro-N-acetylmuramic acid kinase [Flavobacteriaceae bacterium Ap0902]|nr:anhydro-N-acetylmuramic acid kinase [Flavobacteriaceae bacterium Ap0902]